MAKKLKITLKKSTIGSTPKHRKIIQSLGLKKIRQVVIHENTPVIRGMINKVQHLVEVEEGVFK